MGFGLELGLGFGFGFGFRLGEGEGDGEGQPLGVHRASVDTEGSRWDEARRDRLPQHQHLIRVRARVSVSEG